MAAPQIASLPVAPSRSDDPDNFVAKADAFLGALPDFGTQANQVAEFVNLRGTGLENFTGNYAAGTTYAVKQSVFHLGKFWISRSAANIGNTPAEGSAFWALLDPATASDWIPALVATTANITLSGNQTIDGVSVAAGSRVLVIAQSTASQNGIYVTAAGAWARAFDASVVQDFVTGRSAYVRSGTLNGGRQYRLTSTVSVLGTDAVTFSDAQKQGVTTLGNTTVQTLGAGATSVTSLSNTGTSDLQGNVTLGATTGNTHTLNGKLNVSAGQDTSMGVSRYRQESTSLSAERYSADAAGQNLLLRKSRNAAIGGQSDVQLGDTLGTLNWQGSGGGAYRDAAFLRAIATAAFTAGSAPAALQLATTPPGSVTPVVRHYIDESGSQYRTIPGGSTLYPDFGVLAWINFNGTGTIATRGSGNVSSITDNGVGDYSINFASAMPDTNYAAVPSARGTADAVAGGLHNSTTGINDTTTCRIYTLDTDTGGADDSAYVSVAIFR